MRQRTQPTGTNRPRTWDITHARYGVLREPGFERFPVVMAAGKHPFPFRTRKLSPPAPMVLGGWPPGRVGRRRSYSVKNPEENTSGFLYF